MKVISTLVSKPKEIVINSKKVTTGMYKYPVSKGIKLVKHRVLEDAVVDTKHHGGEFQAAYIFGKNNYAYFENKFPKADWQEGMFGENILVDTLLEAEMMVGDIYTIGKARVQIIQPRQPCSKFGYRLGNPTAIKAFADYHAPGVYVRVIQEGEILPGDTMELLESKKSDLDIVSLYRVMMNKSKDPDLNKKIQNCTYLPHTVRQKHS